MNKPTRKRRPSMYATNAQIRRQVMASIGKEIHSPTGLTNRMVDTMINTEVRYCIWWRTKSGRKMIAHVSHSDSDSELTKLATTKRAIDLAMRAQKIDAPETHIGMCEIRLMSPSKIASYGKFKAWVDAANPKPKS